MTKVPNSIIQGIKYQIERAEEDILHNNEAIEGYTEALKDIQKQKEENIQKINELKSFAVKMNINLDE